MYVKSALIRKSWFNITIAGTWRIRTTVVDAIKMELLEDSQGQIQATLYEIPVSMWDIWL